MTDLFETVASRLELGTDESPDGLCVAWSGGLDSTVLMDLLVRARRCWELELAALHVDHGLRPGSADDAALCRRLADGWGVPLEIVSIEVADDDSRQAAARRQRYAALARASRRFGCEAIATAHHADDALETALLQFVRGSSSAGLASLAPDPPRSPAPIAAWDDLDVRRPLAPVTRDQLESYADARDLEWRRDPTNAERTYTRNRLRHDVLPVLADAAGSREPMRRTIANLADEARALERRVDRLQSSAEIGRIAHGALAWHTDRLAEAEPAEIALLLRRAGRRLPGRCRWRREHLETVVEAVASAVVDETRRRIGTGGALCHVEPGRTTLELERRRGSQSLDARRAHPLQIPIERAPLELPWFEFTLAVRVVEPADPLEFPEAAGRTWFDLESLPDRLELAGPRPGGRLAALGFEGHKRLNDLLREADVPESLRWQWPCLYTPDETCLWVAGLRRSRFAPSTSETRRVLAFELSGNVPPVATF